MTDTPDKFAGVDLNLIRHFIDERPRFPGDVDKAFLRLVPVARQMAEALQIGLVYTAIVSAGNTKMPITLQRAKSDTEIIEQALNAFDDLENTTNQKGE